MIESQTKAEQTGGPLQRRSERALRGVCPLFGREIGCHRMADESLAVTVSGTHDQESLEFTLHYEKDDFLLSRVYDLRITLTGEWGSSAEEFKIDFAKKGAQVVPVSAKSTSALADCLNQRLSKVFPEIDLKSFSVVDLGEGRFQVEVVPIGGAYVWILVPPVSYTVRFPDGEPGRLLELLATVRSTLSETR